jgi:hypothetical protein
MTPLAILFFVTTAKAVVSSVPHGSAANGHLLGFQSRVSAGSRAGRNSLNTG